ncbi:MAG: hypothetical protein IPJ41_16750 [Phycisphaerales bacterium]|nr:hypothetical protein [Phycisphaerales bacterium]
MGRRNMGRNWVVGVLAVVVGLWGCDSGRTGPGTNGNPPVSKAASFSFNSPTLYDARGAGQSSLKGKCKIVNKTDQPITQAFVSVSGAAAAAGVRLFSDGYMLKPGKSREWMPNIPVLAQSGDRVDVVLVAVALADGTVFGDGSVVGNAPTWLDPNSATAEQLAAMSPKALRRLPPEVLGKLPPGLWDKLPGDVRESLESGEIASSALFTAPWAGEVFDASSASLVRAVYGAGESWVDVTDHIGAVAAGDTHECRVDPLHFGIPDPAPGVIKTLAMTLDAGGQTFTLTEQDGDWVRLGAPTEGDMLIGASGPPVQLGGVQLLAVWYGTESRWLDALDRFRPFEARGAAEFAKADELAPQDVAPGRVKQVRLYYVEGGERRIAVLPNAGAALAVPFGGVRPVEGLSLPVAPPAPATPRVEEAWIKSKAPPFAPARRGSSLGPGADGFGIVSPADAKLFGRGDITLVSGEYGAGGRVADVTESLRDRMGAEDGLCGLWASPGALGVEDPAPGEAKRLTVALRVGERDLECAAADGAELVIGAPGAIEGMIGTTAAPIELDGMRVWAAWYGAGQNWSDAMAGLRGEVRDDALITRAVSGLVGYDPARDVVKELRLYFERGGKTQMIVYRENAAVKLPIDE